MERMEWVDGTVKSGVGSDIRDSELRSESPGGNFEPELGRGVKCTGLSKPASGHSTDFEAEMELPDTTRFKKFREVRAISDGGIDGNRGPETYRRED